MKRNFSNLSPQIQLIFSSVPVYVSSTVNPDEESSQQTIARQEIFLKLRKGIRWKLASFETGDKIQAIGQKYRFELLRLANITRLIREYYFGEVDFKNFPAEIEKRMGVSLLTAQEITRYLKQEIIDWDPWAEYMAKLPKMPIREIAQRFPKIANMEITAGYIKLKNSQDLENPTIKNWLKDYISHLGYDRHSQMDRTQYIFHSENGKDLDSQNREKLSIILKSFDENVPLPVDEENGEIVFDGIEDKVGDAHVRPAPAKTSPQPSPYQGEGDRPLPKKPQPAPQTTNNFIKPYAPISRQTSPQPSPYKGEGGDRPQHRMIDPFFSKPKPEPRLDGNIVDLSEQ